MSRFEPTLRLDMDAEQVAAAEAAGVTFEELSNQTKNFFENAEINDKLTFTAEKITDIETGIVLHDYHTTIVGKFTIDGDLFVKTAMGDIIKVEFNLI